MKNKFLFLTIAAIGALLITASNGFSYGGEGDNVNAACAPASPYTGAIREAKVTLLQPKMPLKLAAQL
jgi:hypothetical protein